MIDSSSQCIAVTLYNLAPGKGVIIGDSVAICEPFLSRVAVSHGEHSYAFDLIRVDSPLVLVSLQELRDRVKLLLVLRTAEQQLVAQGLVCFPLPIMEHTETLVVKDKKSLYAGIVQSL